VSANRTIVSRVAIKPVAPAETVYLGLDLMLLRLQPGELASALRQRLQVADDKRAHRATTLGSGDAGVAIDLVGNRDRNVLRHSFTVTHFL
jgi:hypothetical protein